MGETPEVGMRRRRVYLGLLALYLVGLGWGYVRLPVAAIKSLRDYRLIASAPAVSIDPGTDVSDVQRWYLGVAFAEVPAPAVPRLAVDVKWNVLIVARVSSGYYMSPTGAEWRDSLYVCVFGAWVPVYTFQETVA